MRSSTKVNGLFFKRVAQNAGIVLVSILIGLVIVEVYLRVNLPQAIYAIRYCYLGWCHVPGVSFVHGGETGEFVTRVQYNSQGLRDYEYSLDKPAGAKRVLIFGDSYAEGLEVEMEDLHAKRLERLLHERFPTHSVQVINFGVSAYDTAQEWWYFKTEGVRYQPDLVVVIWTGEIGSPFAKISNGRPVFIEPQYSRIQMWSRSVKTFLKLHFYTASFLFDRLHVNRSVLQFLEEFAHSPGRFDQQHISDQSDVPQQSLERKTQFDQQHISDQSDVPQQSLERKTQLAIFEDFQLIARAHGARLVVATMYSSEYRELTELLKSRPIPGLITVDLQRASVEEVQGEHYPKDGHWNSRGHEKAARILFDLIMSQNLLDLL